MEPVLAAESTWEKWGRFKNHLSAAAQMLPSFSSASVTLVVL